MCHTIITNFSIVADEPENAIISDSKITVVVQYRLSVFRTYDE